MQPFFSKDGLFVFEKLIEITGAHAVVKLAYLICLSTVESLKLWVGCDDVNLPGGERLEVYSDLSVKLFNLTKSAEAFAIRGIADDSASSSVGGDFSRILTEHLYYVINTCKTCIFSAS